MILKDKLVFIVEDNPQNRVVFQMSLIRHGATVSFERWGHQTIERLNSVSHVDVIILDLMLAHDVSGFDLFDEIRAVPRFAKTPILAVSAMDPAVALAEARVRGFSGFIAKPIDRYQFPDQVARAIAGEQVWYVGERKLT
jgi:CheY-like chemotaxis protein